MSNDPPLKNGDNVVVSIRPSRRPARPSRPRKPTQIERLRAERSELLHRLYFVNNYLKMFDPQERQRR